MLGWGAKLMGVGVHPTAAPGEADVYQTPRYALIEDSLQGVLRTPICGQHIHVGMPDAETAVRAYNGIRTHVPLLNALAANSPFWFGEDSGLASSRTVIFRSYPRAAMAPEFSDFEHFCRVTRQVCVAGGLDDYTHIWWDVRIHPGLGTIEIRARVELSGHAPRVRVRTAQPRRRRVPARTLGRQCLDTAATAAAELDCEQELEYVAALLETGSGAGVQRRVHANHGMQGLLAFLVRETARLD